MAENDASRQERDAEYLLAREDWHSWVDVEDVPSQGLVWIRINAPNGEALFTAAAAEELAEFIERRASAARGPARR